MTTNFRKFTMTPRFIKLVSNIFGLNDKLHHVSKGRFLPTITGVETTSTARHITPITNRLYDNYTYFRMFKYTLECLALTSP